MFEQVQPLFRDRTDAGRQLAARLVPYQGRNAVVFAIPRGGVPVAIEIAAALKADLDLAIVRKISIPGETEAGFGALTEDGEMVLNQPLVRDLGLTSEEIQHQAETVGQEIARRTALFRLTLPPTQVKGRITIIVDDGLASGFTVIAAIQSMRKRKAAEVIVAVPVASASAYAIVKTQADNLVVLFTAQTRWFAVASYYRNWYDLDDNEVIQYLESWKSHSQLERNI